MVFSKDTRSNISEAAPKNRGQSDRDAQKDLPKKWRIRPLRYRTDGNRRYPARERVTSCSRSGARNSPMCRRTDRLRSQQASRLLVDLPRRSRTLPLSSGAHGLQSHGPLFSFVLQFYETFDDVVIAPSHRM